MGKFLKGLGDELSLYARQLAWLNAVPREEKSKILGLVQNKREESTQSRWAKMVEDGIEPLMPPLSLPLMVRWFMQVGPVEQNGVGGAPISWTALRDWQWNEGFRITPWEAETLRRMSRDYLGFQDDARKQNCPAPWGMVKHEANRAAISASLTSFFGGKARGK